MQNKSIPKYNEISETCGDSEHSEYSEHCKQNEQDESCENSEQGLKMIRVGGVLSRSKKCQNGHR